MDGRVTAGGVGGGGPMEGRLCRMRLVRGSTSEMGRAVAASGRGLLIEVDDKVPERVWNADCWEETSNWWVEAS